METEQNNRKETGSTDKTAGVTRIDRSSAKKGPVEDDWQSDVKTLVESVESSFETFVRERPVFASACALGLGFVASLLLTKLGTEKSENKSSNP